MSNDSMRRFHEMEIRNNLFELYKEKDYPLWDMMRVTIYNTLIIGESYDTTLIQKESKIIFMICFLKRLFFSFIDCCRLFLYRRRVFFYENTRDVDENGCYYDHISRQLIEFIPCSRRVVVNNLEKRPTRFKDIDIFFLYYICLFFTKTDNLGVKEYEVIRESLFDTFGKDVSYKYLNSLYRGKKRSEAKFGALFKLLKPSKIFVSMDVQKPIYYVAKRLNIETYEMQHAGIVFEYPSYSYPKEVTSKWNIAFAKHYLQFGNAWSPINNIPSERIVIGNDSFLKATGELYFEKKYIIVISNQEHSMYLRPMTIELSKVLPDYKIVYKLHPDEYKYYESYSQCFGDYPNIVIAKSEYNLQALISGAELLLLIYSSICFEAINMKKKVAVVKKGNYSILYDVVNKCSGVKFVEETKEVVDFLNEPVNQSNEHCDFYCKFNDVVAHRLLKGCNNL